MTSAALGEKIGDLEEQIEKRSLSAIKLEINSFESISVCRVSSVVSLLIVVVHLVVWSPLLVVK